MIGINLDSGILRSFMFDLVYQVSVAIYLEAYQRSVVPRFVINLLPGQSSILKHPRINVVNDYTLILISFGY